MTDAPQTQEQPPVEDVKKYDVPEGSVVDEEEVSDVDYEQQGGQEQPQEQPAPQEQQQQTPPESKREPKPKKKPVSEDEYEQENPPGVLPGYCRFIITRGPRKGLPCGKRCARNHPDYCTPHVGSASNGPMARVNLPPPRSQAYTSGSGSQPPARKAPKQKARKYKPPPPSDDESGSESDHAPDEWEDEQQQPKQRRSKSKSKTNKRPPKNGIAEEIEAENKRVEQEREAKPKKGKDKQDEDQPGSKADMYEPDQFANYLLGPSRTQAPQAQIRSFAQAVLY